MNVSPIVPESPANTVTVRTARCVPSRLSLPTAPDDASVVSPAVSTVTVSPGLLSGAHVFTNVNVALLRTLVSVHVIAVSDGLTVNVEPTSGAALPTHDNVVV